LSPALLDRLPNLKVISQTGKIAPHVNVPQCTERGIAVMEGSGAGSSTAEHTWSLIMASSRNLVDEANRLRAGLWQGSVGRQLSGRRLGIWGYGRIGKLIANYGKAFGMDVWIWGREQSRKNAQQDGVGVAPSKEAFFAESDVISLQLRLNDDTYGIVLPTDLARMKPTALIVNTSRAELIQRDALAAALVAGRPGFAAVDVYESEPVLNADYPLINMKNALCTPHLGFVEQDNYERYFGIAFENIDNFAKGNFADVLNPEAIAARQTTS
jgi:D-3-phosphoglycerate dehydrogenase